MTLMIHIVNIFSTIPLAEEHFMRFVLVDDTSGETLIDCVLDKLKDLGTPLEHCHGQGYHNRANMKGRHSGVQKRILKRNLETIFIPCGCHSLHLVLCDVARPSTLALSFFGYSQRIYQMFSASTKR